MIESWWKNEIKKCLVNINNNAELKKCEST